MSIKICCENMKYYIDHCYIKYNGELVIIDTSDEDNGVKMEYCPFCGEKIKLEE